MNVRPICSIARAHNGWIVTVEPAIQLGPQRSVLCLTWEEVEKVVKDAAFPYPTPDPRMP